MITIENIGSKIYIYGRDKQRVLHENKVNFKPYFYYEHYEGKHKSISGVSLKKVFTKDPKHVKKVRDNYENHHEADIVYTNRFIIDNFDKIEQDEIRICYIDIEIAKTEKGYESPEKANNPIICIGCYDSFDKKYWQVCLGKTHNNEKRMLMAFINYVKEKDPDMFIAWNGDGFDFPFIINRLQNLGINNNKLGRIEQKCYAIKHRFKNHYTTKVFGRICFDLLQGYKKITAGQGRESWSLDYISQYENVGEKEKYKGELDDLYKTDIEKFLLYNKKDVELMVLLNEKLRIVDFFDELRRLCFCKFEDVFMNSKIADCLCLRTVKGKYILPSVQKNKRLKYEGGFVHDSEPKIHKNIAVMDMKSLYPSIMIGFNTSYETYLQEREEGCLNIDDKFYYKREPGLIPSIVKPLLDERKEVKDKMKVLDKNSREYKTLWMTQYALKTIANSFYGVLGFPLFRLFKGKVAETITYMARKIIKEVHKWFEEKGLKIVYGDTDSCFIEMGEKSINDFISLNNDINNYFKTYFKKLGVEDKNNIFKLEFEKVYKTVLFKRKACGEGAKKRYAGRIIWEDGEYVDKFSVVGFESKRSDSPRVGRVFIREVLKMLCYEKSKEEIDKYIEDFKLKIKTKFEVEDFALPISISKNLDSYGNTIHVRAARNANKHHNAQIQQGDKIKYVFIKNSYDNVVAFKSGSYMWDGYQIDYDKMIMRIVDMKVGPLYQSLGWDYKYLILPGKKKKKEVRFEDTLKQMGLW